MNAEMRRRGRIVRAAAAIVILIAALSYSVAPAASAAARVLGKPTPSFTLPDVQGKRHALAEFRGRPVVLFFYCGCDACHRCAALWAEAQDNDALPPAQARSSKRPSPSQPVTVVVYSGDAAAARRFAAETGLKARDTVLLVDPEDRVTDSYGVASCPRVFVLDARGELRYTNDEPGADPQKTPALSLVSRALTALRGCALIKNTP
jgi:peroxiredoxin